MQGAVQDKSACIGSQITGLPKMTHCPGKVLAKQLGVATSVGRFNNSMHMHSVFKG